jgi:HPt (histidine-containing phosphotransfer) domain-containing protein
MSDDQAREDAALGEELQRHYLSTANDKLARVEGALAGLRNNPAAVEDACLTLHTLAGNAGTYGFPEISAEAAAISKQLRAENRASPELLGALEKFREHLEAEFARARARLSIP